MGRLSQDDVKEAIASGKTVRLFDGNSLSLHVRPGSALWEYQFRDGQSMRTRSLGSAASVAGVPGMSPAAARKRREEEAAKHRAERKARKDGNSGNSNSGNSAVPNRMRFADVVESFITLKASEWKVGSREPEHYRRLKDGALGKLWAHDIGKTDVETELRTRWGDALANANKYRIRIEGLIDHAVAKDARAENLPNPARREVIKHLIPAAPETVHRAAMSFSDVPALYAELVADGSPAARSLAFLILTTARNREARLAEWPEVIGDAWIVPGGRGERSMKEGNEHAVPLSPAALALLGKRKASGLIFGEMHKAALLEKLHALRPEVDADGNFLCTVHGFRTSLTSWAKKHKYGKALRDLAKAHKVALSPTDAAYEDRDDIGRADERAEQLETLRPMLQAWSDFVTGG
jgi:integrase